MFNWRKPLIHFLFKKDTDILKHLDDLQEKSSLPREEILDIQKKELEKILRHSYVNVPYYKRIFDEIGIFDGDKLDLSKFQQIPILTKDIIRKAGADLCSKDLDTRKWYKNTSGGSTGVPVEFIQDYIYRDRSWANKIMYSRMVGKDDGEREVKLWGSERDIFHGGETWRTRIQNWLYNRLLLNSFRMTEEKMFKYTENINEFKPVLIWSYIDSIHELAKFIEKNNLKIHTPKAILVTAGTVYPKIKEYISSVFKAPVYNQYGSREAGDMACECPEQRGLHVFEYLYIFEILDKDLRPTKAGEIGEIYVTLLMNYSMPLIRYKIGDTASWTGETVCGCGRNLALINDVHGRITDHFKKLDGAIIHGEYFTHLFYFKDWIGKFQVKQKRYDLVECAVVKNGEENISDINDIREKIKLVMGDDCLVDFLFVDDIEPSRSGKFLYTVSELENKQ